MTFILSSINVKMVYHKKKNICMHYYQKFLTKIMPFVIFFSICSISFEFRPILLRIFFRFNFYTLEISEYRIVFINLHGVSQIKTNLLTSYKNILNHSYRNHMHFFISFNISIRYCLILYSSNRKLQTILRFSLVSLSNSIKHLCNFSLETKHFSN